jgi:phasin family protein
MITQSRHIIFAEYWNAGTLIYVECVTATAGRLLLSRHNSPTEEQVMANPRPDEKQSESRQEKTGPQTGSPRENIRALSDVGNRFAGSAAEISQRAAQTGMEMLDRNKETSQQLWESSSELVAYMMRRSTDQMGRFIGLSGGNAESIADKSSKNFDALVMSSDVLTSASRELSQEWLGMMRRMVDVTVGRSESLAACRTPHDLFASQLEIFKNPVETALHSAKRLSEISAEAAKEAAEKMSEAAKRAA